MLLSLALSAFRARDWSSFFSYLIGLVFCGVFSVASTYGALSHGRNESAVKLAATETRRAEIVNQKERDEASLSALPSARPTAAINAEISALLDSRKDLDLRGFGSRSSERKLRLHLPHLYRHETKRVTCFPTPLLVNFRSTTS
jgi:hypothetical protein